MCFVHFRGSFILCPMQFRKAESDFDRQHIVFLYSMDIVQKRQHLPMPSPISSLSLEPHRCSFALWELPLSEDT